MRNTTTKKEMTNLKRMAKELLNRHGIKAFMKDITMLEASGTSYLYFEHNESEYCYRDGKFTNMTQENIDIEKFKEEWKAKEEKRKEAEEERNQIEEKIDSMIGTVEENEERRNQIKNYQDKLNYMDWYEKQRQELRKLAYKYGIEKLSGVMIVRGRTSTGMTAKGKKYVWYGNNGVTIRSWNCGTLVINGEEIFTSGTISKAMEYIINN